MGGAATTSSEGDTGASRATPPWSAISPRGWARFRPVDVGWPSAVRATIGANTVLVAVVLLGLPELAPAAAFGGMTAVHARFEPFAVRGRLLAGIGIGMVASVAAGVVAAAAQWPTPAIVVLVAVIAALAKFLTDAVGSGPPAGLIFVFAAATMAMLPVTWAGAGAHVGAGALGAVVGWAVAMWGRLVNPHAPVRMMTGRALDAVLATRDSDDIHPAIEAIDTAWRAVATLPAHKDVGGLEALLVEAEAALIDPDRGAATLRARAAELRSWAFTPSARRRRGRLDAHGPSARQCSVLPDWGRMVREAARPGSPIHTGTARVGLGVLVAGLVATVLDLGHAYWAMVAAAAVLQSTNVRHTVHRSVQRAAGTVAGAALGAMLLLADLPHPAMMLCIVLALLAAECCVLRNYGVALVFITPLTLLLASILVPVDPGVLVFDRVVDTLLGSVIGLAAALIVPGHRHARSVRSALTAAEAANAELAVRLTAGSGAGRARAEVRSALSALRRARETARGELVGSAVAEHAVAAERDGYRLLRKSA